MEEATLKKELNLIPIARTGAAAIKPAEKKHPGEIRRKRDGAARGLIRVAVVSMALNVILAVMAYISLAGPV